MTETLNGKQVLALLAQDEVREIEFFNGEWIRFNGCMWSAADLRITPVQFRIKPTPARRLSVTLSNGEVVSWPEPVREASELKEGTKYYIVLSEGDIDDLTWYRDRTDTELLAFGSAHLTREAAQEHADALRKINCQEVGKC